MAKSTDNNEALKRLGGGRWQTRDERFTIEPQSGTWVVVDAEQTDDLGLALIRGPFASLGSAKEAIATARDSEPATSPLAARAEENRNRTARAEASTDEPQKGREAASASRPATTTKPSKTSRPAKPEVPAEPRWMADLGPDERRRTRRLIDRLAAAGASDPEGIARRDLVGKVPAAAAFAIERAILALKADASAAAVARLLADGRDEDLGVRWRLVDGDGRPITLDPGALEADP